MCSVESQLTGIIELEIGELYVPVNCVFTGSRMVALLQRALSECQLDQKTGLVFSSFIRNSSLLNLQKPHVLTVY